MKEWVFISWSKQECGRGTGSGFGVKASCLPSSVWLYWLQPEARPYRCIRPWPWVQVACSLVRNPRLNCKMDTPCWAWLLCSEGQIRIQREKVAGGKALSSKGWGWQRHMSILIVRATVLSYRILDSGLLCKHRAWVISSNYPFQQCLGSTSFTGKGTETVRKVQMHVKACLTPLQHRRRLPRVPAAMARTWG